ncbi:MAG: class I SAM-dependent methyltransferase [Myxococcales bacterium]|nr:class I SAM-dependent methyltransferase [Myxococcales bacterium]
MTAFDPEREFVEYWEKHLADPRDPQLDRWRALERTQVARAREKYRTDIERFASLEGRRALDVGCQCGALAVALAERGALVTGLDVEASLLEGARARARGYGVTATFVKGVAEALPFDDRSFDLVTMVDVIEHVEDSDRAIAECARVLAPGGTLYLQGPNRLSPRWFRSDPHYQMFAISVLPPALGRFYVTRVRGRPRYDVGTFPVGLSTRRTLERLGLTLASGPGFPAKSPMDWLRSWVGLTVDSMFTLVAHKR